jgi:hypothetical protein
MIYLIGGAPRSGKSILGQQVSAQLKVGWVSTDLLAELLRLKDEDVKAEWNAVPEAITALAEWFFPYLERFVWGASSLAENYLIEGVSFLSAQVAELSRQYPIGVSGLLPNDFGEPRSISGTLAWLCVFARRNAPPDRSRRAAVERIHSTEMRAFRLSLHRHGW